MLDNKEGWRISRNYANQTLAHFSDKTTTLVPTSTPGPADKTTTVVPTSTLGSAKTTTNVVLTSTTGPGS